jgi:hypothetical protein
VQRGQRCKGAPSVDRFHDRRIHDIDHVGVLRIGGDIHVVPRPRLDEAVLAQQPPRLPRIVTAEQPTLLRLHDGIQPIRIGRRYRHADLAHQLRQALRQPSPRVATVRRLPDPTAGTATAHLPRQPLVIPERSVENPRIRRIHREVIGAARRVRALEHQRPRFPAITRAVDPTLSRPLPAITLNGRVYEIRIGRMHAHLRNLARALEPDPRERPASVRAAEHSIAVRRRLATHRILAGADIDDVRIRFRHRDGADRPVHARATRSIGDHAPRVSRILRLPHATARIADVVRIGLRRHAGHRIRPAATEGSDVPPLHGREERGVVGTLGVQCSGAHQHAGEHESCCVHGSLQRGGPTSTKGASRRSCARTS